MPVLSCAVDGQVILDISADWYQVLNCGKPRKLSLPAFAGGRSGHATDKKPANRALEHDFENRAPTRALNPTLTGEAPDRAFSRIERARGRPVPDTDEQREWVRRFATDPGSTQPARRAYRRVAAPKAHA